MSDRNLQSTFTKNIWTFCPDDQVHGQPDLESWEASNPIRLIEMYGNDTNLSDYLSHLQYKAEADTHMIPFDNCMDSKNHSYKLDVGKSEQELESGSAFNPIHLTEMYRNNEVTLPNHATDSSAFDPYSRIKQMDLVWPNSIQKISEPRILDDFFLNDGEEDLFYSELTHFMPIENFVEDSDSTSEEENFIDGTCFNISKTSDNFQYERTSSGLLRYMSEEYLEYACNNVEVANSNQLDSRVNRAFVIKFNVKRSGEKACQTEDQEDFQLTSISDEGKTNISYDINNTNDNISNTSSSKGYGCGLKYLYKSLFKKISRCCGSQTKTR